MDKHRIDSIYSEILDCPPEQRDGRLEQLCGGNAALRTEVESLLRAADQPDIAIDARFESIRNSYWREIVGSDRETEEDLSGTQVGIWRLRARVGRGGIATVYLANREDGEFSQRAAFKVMRRGLDTDDLISRFRAEREILAALDHPGIAGILDGGTMPDGRPYLVLEFVDGVDIVEYAEAHQLSLRKRLALLQQVAAALHHAHQHLVVHRDVKPSNVMVTRDGTVRLLDFGIAKILDPSTSPIASRLTKTGISMLTPAYGSPELVSGAPVTTGSDVYQLGLLMAEVLTGVQPAAVPGTAPAPSIEKIKDRDLRAIIQKATRESSSGRYESALEFAADLDRYLNNRPVLARADSWIYRTLKFLKRRPLLAPIAAGVVITAVIYIVTITSYSREVERQRAVAEQTQAFMIALFESPDPRAPADPERGRSITVVEALDIGMDRVESELADQPYLQASLSRTIAAVYEALDQFRPAIRLQQKALELEELLYGADSSRALESMRTLARLQRKAGNLDAAESLTQRQLDITRAMSSPGLEQGFAEHAAALQALESSEDEEAAELLQSAIQELLSQGNLDGKIDATRILELLENGQADGNPREKIEKAEQLALQVLGPDSRGGLITTVQVASALTKIGAYEQAEQRYLATLPKLEAMLGIDHPDVLSTTNNLGYLYAAWDRHAEAETVHRQLLERNLQISGPLSQAVAFSYQNLATSVGRQGRIDEALQLHRQALATFSSVFDESHYLNALPLMSMAYLQLSQNRLAKAADNAGDALAILEQAQPGSYLTGISQCLLGTAKLRLGNSTGDGHLVAARKLLTPVNTPAPYAEFCGVAEKPSTATRPSQTR